METMPAHCSTSMGTGANRKGASPLAGCGITISAQQYFESLHVRDKRRTHPRRMLKKAVQQGHSKRRGEAYASVR